RQASACVVPAIRPQEPTETSVAETRSGPDRGGAAPAVLTSDRPADGWRGVDDDDALAELRTLLIGQERDQLASILERLDDPAARRREVAGRPPHLLPEPPRDPRFL